MPKNSQRCFVIMPFSQTSEEHTEEYWTEHFDSFLKPNIEDCGLIAHRSEPLRGDVLKQIITDLVVCPVVVSDLTDRNPNVFWELGVRQSFKQGTVTIAEQGTKIPFDVGVKATLFYYPKDHIKNSKFVKQFKRAIKDCLSHPDRSDSHVLETISGRGTLYEIIRRDEAVRRTEALVSEYKYNSEVVSRIYKYIKKEEIVTDRLRSSSVEMLTTHRYLDEESEFYELAETYFDYVFMINEQLTIWESFHESTVKWFKAMKKQTQDVFKDYEKAPNTTRQRLLALL